MDFALDWGRCSNVNVYENIRLRCPHEKALWAFSKMFWKSIHFASNISVSAGVLHPISKHQEVDWKNEAQPSYFSQLRGVWILDETLYWVFDIASQTI